MRIELPVYPSVTDLDGEITANGISLSWSEPNIADMPAKPVTETFESYASFIISGIGDWTLVDGDGLKTIQMTLSGLDDPPAVRQRGQAVAFQVFNPEKPSTLRHMGIPIRANRCLPHSVPPTASMTTSPTTTG